MPYLSSKRKAAIDAGAELCAPGDLAYVVTRETLRYLGQSPNFARYAEAVGALESAKLEMYRRALAIYEESAINRNGDLWWPVP